MSCKNICVLAITDKQVMVDLHADEIYHCHQVDMYGVKERVQGVIVSLTGDTKPNSCRLYLLNLLTLFMPDP